MTGQHFARAPGVDGVQVLDVVEAVRGHHTQPARPRLGLLRMQDPPVSADIFDRAGRLAVLLAYRERHIGLRGRADPDYRVAGGLLLRDPFRDHLEAELVGDPPIRLPRVERDRLGAAPRLGSCPGRLGKLRHGHRRARVDGVGGPVVAVAEHHKRGLGRAVEQRPGGLFGDGPAQRGHVDHPDRPGGPAGHDVRRAGNVGVGDPGGLPLRRLHYPQRGRDRRPDLFRVPPVTRRQQPERGNRPRDRGRGELPADGGLRGDQRGQRGDLGGGELPTGLAWAGHRAPLPPPAGAGAAVG
jgi:hypothetical protein